MDAIIYFNIEKDLDINQIHQMLRFESAPRLYKEGSTLVKKVDKSLKSAERSIITNGDPKLRTHRGNEINELYIEIKNYLNTNIVSISNRGEIVKYGVGGFVAPHTDIANIQSTNCKEKTLVYYIEAPLSGGETVIEVKSQSNEFKTFKCKPGDVLIFDKDLIHSCNEILEGTKIIFIGDIFIEYPYDIEAFLESDELFLPVNGSILDKSFIFDRKKYPGFHLLSGTLIDFNNIYYGDEYKCKCFGDLPELDCDPSDDRDFKYISCEDISIDCNRLIRESHLPECCTVKHELIIPFLFFDNYKLIEYSSISYNFLPYELEFHEIIEYVKTWRLDESFWSTKIDCDVELFGLHGKFYDLVLETENILTNPVKFQTQHKHPMDTETINTINLKKCTDFIKTNYKDHYKSFKNNFMCDWGRDGALDIDCNVLRFYVLAKNSLFNEYV